MLIAGVVLFFIGIVLIICYPINKRKNARCTEQTQGMLSDIRRRYNSKGSLKSMHIYSYQVNGVKYRLETLDYSPQVRRIGDPCTIWYNPSKPKDAQAYRGSDKYLKTLLLIGVGLTLLGIIVICFGFVREFIL